MPARLGHDQLRCVRAQFDLDLDPLARSPDRSLPRSASSTSSAYASRYGSTTLGQVGRGTRTAGRGRGAAGPRQQSGRVAVGADQRAERGARLARRGQRHEDERPLGEMAVADGGQRLGPAALDGLQPGQRGDQRHRTGPPARCVGAAASRSFGRARVVPVIAPPPPAPEPAGPPPSRSAATVGSRRVARLAAGRRQDRRRPWSGRRARPARPGRASSTAPAARARRGSGRPARRRPGTRARTPRDRLDRGGQRLARAGRRGRRWCPAGRASAMSSIRVRRVNWRRVTDSCLRTSTTDAVGRLEKSLGQTSRTEWSTAAPAGARPRPAPGPVRTPRTGGRPRPPSTGPPPRRSSGRT